MFLTFATQFSVSWPWYIIRGSGFVAAGLLILLMLSGIGQVTGLTYRFLEPVKAWTVHRAMALALCVAIALHAGFLLVDHFVHFSLAQILVPFQSTYTNGTKVGGIALGSLAVTLGILAMYGVAVIVASSLGLINRKKKVWRSLHYTSYFVMLAVFIHALYTGTDLRYGVFRAAWIGLIIIVALAVVSRLARAGSLKKEVPEA